MMPGMIMLWSGSVETIPSGWHICDGTMGTPDLDTRFVIGAGEGMAQGTRAGSSKHWHYFTGDGHAHDLSEGDDVLSDAPNGNKYHGTSVSPATGKTEEGVNMPPYEALYYIMKL